MMASYYKAPPARVKVPSPGHRCGSPRPKGPIRGYLTVWIEVSVAVGGENVVEGQGETQDARPA